MKNRKLVHARQEAQIYRDHYRPSFNLWRFTKSILSVLIFGNATAAHTYIPGKKRGL